MLLNGREDSRQNVDPLVDFNGTVIWVLPKDFIAKCEFDLRYFPFDDQTCTFTFGINS